MSFSYLKKMPDPDTIKSEFALTPEMKALKADRDQQIADIITGKDDRVLAIIGPCSADNEDSVCEYVKRSKTVCSSFLVSIPINLGPPVPVTRALLPSRILPRHRIWSRV